MLRVWITMLALKGSDHVYRGSAYQLSDQAKKTEQEVLDALKVLSSPDTRRIEPQEHEGRRIKAVPDGWLVINGEKYRALMSEEMKKARLRRAQAAWRRRQKGTPLPGEIPYVQGVENGTVDAATGLPTKKVKT